MASGRVPIGTAALIGRASEAAALRRAVDTARAGRASAVVVVGESGVGKTRLVGEAIADARRAGIAVLAARARITAPLTYGVIADALRSWLRGNEVPVVAAPFDRGLRRVLPEWQPAGAADPDLDDAQLQLLAAEGVVRLVRAIADAGGAVLLVFDDVHAADAESIEMVRHLIAAEISRTCVIAVSRSRETSTADAFVDALRRDGLATHLSIAPLDGDSVRGLVAGLLDGEPPAELVDDVLQRTDGVPLLVEEVVDAHVRSGSVVVGRDGVSWRGGRGAVPPTVRAMVAARLDGLDEKTRDVLAAAAVAGDLDVGLVEAIADADADQVRSALAAGVDTGVLDTAGGMLSFRHAIVREAIVDAALPSVVARFHRRAAQVLEGRTATGAAAPILERRAGHLLEVGDRDAAAILLIDAARADLASHALLGAERMAHAAVDAAGSGAHEAGASDVLAQVLASLGRWDEALAVDEATAATGGESATRRERMALCALESGRPDLAESLLVRPAGDAAGALVLLGRVALVRGDAATAGRNAGEALAIAIRSGDPDVALAARELQGRALDYLGDREGAQAAWELQAAEATALGRTQSRLRAMVQLGKVELFAGRPPQRVREAVEVASGAGALVELGWAEENYAVALAVGGDLEGARAVLRQSIARCRELRLDQLAYLLAHYAIVESYERDDVEPILAEAEALAPTPDMKLHTAGVRGDIALRRGDYAGALRWLEIGAEILASLPGVVPSDTSCWLVLSLAGVGRHDDAQRALRAAEQMPDLARWYGRPTLVAAAHAILARDAAALDAVLAGAPERMPWDLALLRVVASDLIGGDDRVRWLRDALDWYESRQVTTPVDRVRRLLREAGGAVPRKRRKPVAIAAALAERGVTGREAEVLALLGDGLSNGEIAGRLYVSVRTVETHVSSLLTKLGVRGRGQLIALYATLHPAPPDKNP